MSVLNKFEIRRRLYAARSPDERLFITPVIEPDAQIAEGSVDIRLGSHFIVTRSPRVGAIEPFTAQSVLDTYQERLYVPYGAELWIHPGTFVLGVTLEYLGLPLDVYADVTTRSSFARLGLNIATAVAVHPGFIGCLTLELVNAGNAPIAISPGVRIGQLVLHLLDSRAERRPHDGKYVGEITPQFSRLASESEERDRWKRLSSA